MKKLTVCVLAFCFFILSSFTFYHASTDAGEGVFIFKMNGKEISLKGAKAQYRTITGGHKQLSLSNDKFEAFVFINPSIKKLNFKEASTREVYVKYVEPGTDKIFKPTDGYVDIQTLDLEKRVVSGAFEMVLINKEGPEKKITVSQGKFENIPIVEIRGY